mmetsp:Transcript_26365/g.83787  ORF Transcript_26365/g.83787 Transcript_26365/m.83787 type:complete len:210 (+) Transcript_26365:1886-2515(+)
MCTYYVCIRTYVPSVYHVTLVALCKPAYAFEVHPSGVRPSIRGHRQARGGESHGFTVSSPKPNGHTNEEAWASDAKSSRTSCAWHHHCARRRWRLSCGGLPLAARCWPPCGPMLVRRASSCKPDRARSRRNLGWTLRPTAAGRSSLRCPATARSRRTCARPRGSPALRRFTLQARRQATPTCPSRGAATCAGLCKAAAGWPCPTAELAP